MLLYITIGLEDCDMGYVKMSCPSCGGSVEYSGDKEFFFCEYCGTKIIKDKQFVELSGAVSVSGIASTDALLERAFLFLEDGDYLSANDYLEKTLDVDPKCAKAYIGKLLCQLHLREPDALISNDAPLTEYPFYNKAIRFASPTERQEYQAYNQAVLDKISETKKAKLAEIASAKQRIAELEFYLKKNKKQNLINITKKILWKTLLIISICCVVFWTIGTIVVFPVIIIDIPFILWMIIMIRLNIRAKKSTQQYETAKLDLENVRRDLSKKETNYNRWLLDHSF